MSLGVKPPYKSERVHGVFTSCRIPLVTNSAYRQLPSLDRLLALESLRVAASELGPSVIASAAREELALRRTEISKGGLPDLEPELLAEATLERAFGSLRATLQPVINATGVILHTNLGRAPLSTTAIEAMARVSQGYSNLEFDLSLGERGSRHSHLESLLCGVTGAEAAIAVNNNAAALLLTLSALASDREVIISRGQLVEIGGGFRIPDVMRQSGVTLVEVGATNRTYSRDYDEAITQQTVGLMRVHASNFRISGFAASATISEMAELSHSRDILLFDDLGSGCLMDTRVYGLPQEPTPRQSLEAGADIVLFSGDKLLGGPQAGIIVGKASIVDRLRRHPLARALRLDKATIAALNATLVHYVKGEAEEAVPIWRMISTPENVIQRRARRWARAVGHGSTVLEGRSMIGGGSLPEESLATRLLAIPPLPGINPGEMARRLREGAPAVVARVEHDNLLLDPRTVHPSDDSAVVRALVSSLTG